MAWIYWHLLDGRQLRTHVFGQTTAGQQQSFADVIAYLLHFFAVHAHALTGVQHLQQQDQPGIGAVDAGQRHTLPRCMPAARPQLTIGTFALADALEATQQGEAVVRRSGRRGGQRGFQRLRSSSGMLAAASPRVANNRG